jgi:thiamine biosynthesis lipoprotein
VKYRILIGLIGFVLLLAGAGHAFQSRDVAAIDGLTMGTSWRVMLDATNRTAESSLQLAIQDRLDRIEQSMSTWIEDSEVSRFNRLDSDEWFPVSEDTAVVVTEALRIAQLSQGAFDPTVAPLIRLWSFDAGSQTRQIPTDADIEEARQHCGWQKLEVRRDPPALRKDDPKLQINLSAIAKGYAVDEVSKLLGTYGWPNHLVEVGGEMRACGLKPDGSLWRVGVETPDELSRRVHRVLVLKDQSIATSGDYRNFFEVDGQRYSHTIDPETGRPVVHSLASVTVVASNCMQADALATAINVLGPEQGMKLAVQEKVSALLIQRDGDRLIDKQTVSFAALIPGTELAPITNGDGDGSLLRTIIAVGGVFAIAIIGMAVGVIFSNRRLRGSCGGLNNMPGTEGSACEICQNPADECRDPLARFRRKPSPAAPTRDADNQT